LQAGASVCVHERSRLPRHKVCGEFLSSEILPLLSRLGVEDRFATAGPAVVRRLELFFGTRSKMAALPEAAFGLSRYLFDELLLARAVQMGALVTNDSGGDSDLPRVIAHGRQSNEAPPKGNRTFGFKAHFRGPAADAIELHFFKGGYVGINSVEAGLINVCGLASEAVLREIGFEYDLLAGRSPTLKERLCAMTRTMEWLSTGPLVYGNRFRDAVREGTYPAGDALSFVDPFTGSGLYCAVLAGILAGENAARGAPAAEHLRQCRQALSRPFAFSTLIRKAVTSDIAEHLAAFIPLSLLYRFTRP
jgi:flavin-dependent dehydrogenase